jgi:hypothetical protein
VKAEKEDLSNVTVEELQEKTIRVYFVLASWLIAARQGETSLVSTRDRSKRMTQSFCE